MLELIVVGAVALSVGVVVGLVVGQWWAAVIPLVFVLTATGALAAGLDGGWNDNQSDGDLRRLFFVLTVAPSMLGAVGGVLLRRIVSPGQEEGVVSPP